MVGAEGEANSSTGRETMDWYYAKHGRQDGPVDEAALRRLLASGALAKSDLVWRQGIAEWVRAEEVAELREPTGSGPGVSPDPPGLQPHAPGDGLTPYAGASRTGQVGSAPLPPGMMMLTAPPTSGLAIASMTCGIVGVLVTLGCLMGGIFGLPAVICGHGALRTIRQSATPVGGRGMAIAGLVTGYLACLGTLALAVYVMVAGFGGGVGRFP